MASRRSKTKCPKCENTLWIYDSLAREAECSLCGHTRTYTVRKKSLGISDSQIRALHKIRNHFVKWNSTISFARFDIEVQEDGRVYFDVKTDGNVYVSEGCSGIIGVRGKITVYTASGLSTVHDRAFYQKWLPRAVVYESLGPMGIWLPEPCN